MEIWNKERETAVEFVNRISKQINSRYVPLIVNGKKKTVLVVDNCLLYKKRINSSVAYYSREEINSIEYKDKKSNEELFTQGLKTALKYLNNSGLWENIKKDIEVMLSIGYEESKKREDLRGTFYMFNRPKIKSISFGNKGLTEWYRNRITNAMKNKEKLSLFERAGYDLSFEYNPEKNKAWWSEEYRGCGNGHYYIMLDDRHALFCEDD